MPKASTSAGSARNAFYEKFPTFDAVRDTLEAGIQVLEYDRGERLFARGAPITHLFFLLRGSVQEAGLQRLPNGAMQPRLVRTVVPTGQRPLPVLGLYEYLDRKRHQTHALVDEPAQVLTIDAATFEKILYLRPELPAALAPLDILDRLRTIPLFSDAHRIELGYIADGMERRQYPAGAAIYAWFNDQLYLIDHGQVEVTQPNNERVWLGNGAAFGLLSKDETARTMAVTELLRIDRHTLAALISIDFARRAEHLRGQRVATLSQLYPFSDPAFNDEVVAQLAGYVSHYFVPKRLVLAQQGAPVDSMWILMPGSHAQLHALGENGEALTTTAVQGPNYFGEAALFAQTLSDSTIEAEANSQWLRLHRADFQSFLRLDHYRLLKKMKLRADVQLVVNGKEAVLRYPWLQEGEGVISTSRRHWVVLLRKTWLSLTTLTVVLMSFAGLAVMPGIQIVAGLGLASLGGVALAFFLWGLYDYWNDYLVVTNRRIVHQEMVLLQSRRLHETGLEQVRNVDLSISFLGQMLGYGLLKVQTAGTVVGTLAFDFVPRVELVQQAIRRRIALRRRHREVAGKDVIQRHLERRLGLGLALPERVRDDEAPLPLAQTRSDLPPWLLQLVGRQEQAPLSQRDLIVWHKHWAVLVARLIAPVLILLGLVAALVGALLFSVAWLGALASGPVSFVLFVAILADLGVIGWRVADWRNDTYEVTREEIADVEKLPLFFDEQRRTARLVDIVDILADIPSLFHYLLNYGNVRLETAATQGEFTFDSVADPQAVVAEIRRRIEAARQREEQARAQQRAVELADWFELYDRIRPDEPVA